MEHLSRIYLLKLMRGAGLRRTLLDGPNRERRSARFLPTTRTLADPIEYFRKAMEAEMKHSADVLNDESLRQTAKIVSSHILGVESRKRPGTWRFCPCYYDH